jgi:branched-chain amino acid transport system permease protein
MKSRAAVIALVLILAVAAPFAIYPVFLMKALCFALFAVAFNLLLGYGGLLSFGHAAFFGMASYVCGHAMTRWGVTPEIAILAGMAAAGVMGLAFGYIAIRRQGIYFAMVTLALAQMVYFFCLQAPFTHGEDGIQAIPRGALFGLLPLDNPQTLYYFVLAVFTAGCAIVWRTVHSPFGQVLRAIRENEPRAISLGYRTKHYKLLAFGLSASLAGLAGATKALVFQLASLTDVHWHTSGEVVLMTLLGGMGTVLGPIAGAFVVVMIENKFADAGDWVTILQGLIFIAVVLLFRKGIVGEAVEWWHRRRRQEVA